MRYPLLIAAMLAVASMCSDHASAADKRSPPFGDLTDEALWRSSLMGGAFTNCGAVASPPKRRAGFTVDGPRRESD